MREHTYYAYQSACDRSRWALLHPLHLRGRCTSQLCSLADAEALPEQLPDLVVLRLIHRPALVHTALVGLGNALRLTLSPLFMVIPGNRRQGNPPIFKRAQK